MVHVRPCPERKEVLAELQDGGEDTFCTICVTSRYVDGCWRHVEIPASSTLEDLRDTWLECCGHMGAFRIQGVTCTSGGNDGSLDMNVKVGDVLKPRLTFDYMRGFGYTASVSLQAATAREGKGVDDLMLLSRNHPCHHLCDACQKNDAEHVDSCGCSEGAMLLCETCMKTLFARGVG